MDAECSNEKKTIKVKAHCNPKSDGVKDQFTETSKGNTEVNKPNK